MIEVEVVEEIKEVERAVEEKEILTIIAIIIRNWDIHESVVGSYMDG